MARKKDTKIKKENIEVMSLDNKPINKEITKEPINIPNKFVEVKMQKPTPSNNKINVINNIVYKDLVNGIGMYADNRQTFRIK